MNKYQFIHILRRYYNQEGHVVRLKRMYNETLHDMISRLGVREILFSPDESEEGFLADLDKEEANEDEYMVLSGTAEIHGIPFDVEMEVENYLAFYLSYEGKPLPFSAFAESFESVRIAERGHLEYTQTPLLEGASIKKMQLQVDDHNLNRHDSTYIWDAIFDFSACEELRDALTAFLPGIEFSSEWRVEGVFYYPNCDSPLCRLNLSSQSAPLPPGYFVMAADDRAFTADQYYLRFNTHVVDDSNLDNYLEDIPQTSYFSELYFGFLFLLPVGEPIQEQPYGAEFAFLRESPVEPCFLSPCSIFSTANLFAQADDALLCHILKLEPGQFLSAINRRVKREELGLFTFIDSVEDMAMSLYCLKNPENGCYELELIYFRIRYRIDSAANSYKSKSTTEEMEVEGCIREADIQAFNPRNIPLSIGFWQEMEEPDLLEDASMNRQGAQAPGSMLLSSIAGGTPALSFPGLVLQVDLESQMFRMEVAPPIGTSISTIGSDAADWDPGFAKLPGSRDIKVTYFLGEGSLRDQEFQLALTLDTSHALTFKAGKLAFTVEEIGGYLNYSPQNTGIGLNGILRFTLDSSFSLALLADYEKTEGTSVGLWTFEAALWENTIPLVEIVNSITGWSLSFELDVDRLDIRYCTDGSYLFDCGITAGFPVFGGQMTISVRGRIEKSAQAENPDILLEGQLFIQYFLFHAKIHLLEDGSKQYAFSVLFDSLEIEAIYETNHSGRRAGLSAEEEGGVLTILLKNFTIGGIIRALMRALRPNVNFKLSKPWDMLNRVGFPEIHILFDTVTEDISVTMPMDIDLLILQIQEVGFTYVKETGAEEAKFNILVKYDSLVPMEDSGGRMLENGGAFYLWDAFHDSAPGPVSAQEKKKFELAYFGLGRHVDLGLQGVPDQSLFALLDVCREHVKQTATLPTKVYDDSYGWFVGARFTVMEFLEAGLLFYDPELYGIQARVLNNDIVPLKGLDLTIYYRKVTEDIGVFYANVTLPDCIRNMDFGALSVTLPSIEVWIYTNGNFKVNFGFPQNDDFSHSFALSYGIFYGRGGFYFGYLNGNTSSNVPATTKGYFDPVIELGIGITVGVGKHLSLGVLKLSASLELSGIFEGVFARFVSADGKVTATYYRCRGTVIIAGEIAGEIDFFIIKAGFRLYARVAVTALLESGKATEVALEASFEVSAYVKIWIFKISFKFSYTYRDTFVLGSPSPVPWEDGIPLRWENALSYDWTPKQILSEVRDLPVWLLPYFTKEERSAVWSRMAAQKEPLLLQSRKADGAEKHRIAMLASYERDSITDLLELLCGFALGAQKRETADFITQEQIKELLDALSDGCSGFTAETLCWLLRLNLRFLFEKAAFSVTDSRRNEMEKANDGEADHVPMPLPPVLTLIWETLEDDQSYSSSSFDLSKREYASGLFCEYFLLVAKCGLQKGLSWMQEQGQDGMLCSELMAGIKGQAEAAAGMVSRFLLSGPRQEDLPLYEAVWQQFSGLDPGKRKAGSIVHKFHMELSSNKGLLSTVHSEDFTIQIAEEDLTYPEKPLDIAFQREPFLLPFYSWEHSPVLLYDKQDIFQEDKPVFALWRTAADISQLEHLEIHVARQAPPCDGKEQELLSYSRCFLLRLEIRKARDTDAVYSIVSAEEETRAQLKALAKGAAPLKKSSLLFSRELKNTSESRPAGAYSMDEAFQSDIVLIRQNLSEITTAPVAISANEQEQSCVSFDHLEEAMKLLNHMVQIGGDGHYIGIGKTPLPSELFEDNGHAILTFLIETEDAKDAPLVCLAADAAGGEEVPVINNEELPKKRIQRVKPDEYGFSFTLRQMETAYGQFVYRLDGEDSPPITPQETEGLGEEESYYTHVFSLRPRQDLEPSPLQEPNPYSRVLPASYDPELPPAIQKAELSFGFRDIVGNRTAAEDDYHMKEPFAIVYHDRLFALTELPSTQVSYCFGQTGERGVLKVELCLRCSAQSEEGAEPETMQGIAAQTALAYYQYCCADMVFSLGLSFGAHEAASQDFSQAQRAAVTDYLLRLYQYLKEGTQALRPMDVRLDFSFVCPVPETLETPVCLPAVVTAVVKRDARYVAPDFSEAGTMACSITPDEDLEASCTAFETSIPWGKLMLGEGLYGAFFPKRTLCAAPPELKNLFYSIPPLGVHLMSRSGMILTTVAQRLSGAESEEEVSYYNIDMDQWAVRFFGFLERLFAPEALSRLLSEDVTEPLGKLLQVKRQLARAVAGRTERLFAEEGEDAEARQAAEEALKDYLEKDLERGYGAAGCAVYSVTSSMGQRYALDGSVEDAYGVLECKFTHCTHGAFVTAPGNVAAADSLSMEQAAYVFTHLEDRQEERWYRFIRPFEQFDEYVQVNLSHYEDLRPVVLPVPLRRYPHMPRLIRQAAAASGSDYTHPAWQYEMETECALSAQDRLHLLIHTEGNRLKPGNSAPDLFSALAQFIFNEDEYEALLLGDCREYPLADVLEDVGKQASLICSCWGKALMKNQAEIGMVLAAEYEEGLLCRIRITEEHLPQGLPLPALVITDSEQRSSIFEADRSTMTYPMEKGGLRIEPEEAFQLQAVFGNIPLKTWQALSCSLYLKRNEVFSAMEGEMESLAVHPDFIYETSPMGFGELLYPALRFSQPIAAGSWSVERALTFVGETVGYPAELRTELLLSLGQKAGGAGGPLLFRPLTRQMPGVLTPDMAEAFFRHGQKAWQDKAIEGKGLFHVKLTLRQYPAGAPEEAAGAVLMEIDDVVFDL